MALDGSLNLTAEYAKLHYDSKCHIKAQLPWNVQFQGNCAFIWHYLHYVGVLRIKIQVGIKVSSKSGAQNTLWGLKRTLNDIVDDMPYLKSKLSKFNREKNGRPAVIEDQPDLLNAILNIASIGAVASDRRRLQEFYFVKMIF